jgi:hypothetical protein
MSKYEIRDVVGDYGIFRDGECLLLLNSRRIAGYIKDLLEDDERLDLVAAFAGVASVEDDETVLSEMYEVGALDGLVDALSDEECLKVYRRCIQSGGDACAACTIRRGEQCPRRALEARVLALAERGLCSSGDAIKAYVERLKARLIEGGIYPVLVQRQIDAVAREMKGGE